MKSYLLYHPRNLICGAEETTTIFLGSSLSKIRKTLCFNVVPLTIESSITTMLSFFLLIEELLKKAALRYEKAQFNIADQPSYLL